MQTGILIKFISASEEESFMRIIHTTYEYYKIVLKIIFVSLNKKFYLFQKVNVLKPT